MNCGKNSYNIADFFFSFLFLRDGEVLFEVKVLYLSFTAPFISIYISKAENNDTIPHEQKT